MPRREARALSSPRPASRWCVVAIDAPEAGTRRRLGFLAGQFSVPDDFDRIGATEVEALFGGGPGREA